VSAHRRGLRERSDNGGGEHEETCKAVFGRRGIGTIVGAALGAIIVTLIGVIAAGLSGFYRFISGIIIILALLGHRLQSARVR